MKMLKLILIAVQIQFLLHGLIMELSLEYAQIKQQIMGLLYFQLQKPNAMDS